MKATVNRPASLVAVDRRFVHTRNLPILSSGSVRLFLVSLINLSFAASCRSGFMASAVSRRPLPRFD